MVVRNDNQRSRWICNPSAVGLKIRRERPLSVTEHDKHEYGWLRLLRVLAYCVLLGLTSGCVTTPPPVPTATPLPTTAPPATPSPVPTATPPPTFTPPPTLTPTLIPTLTVTPLPRRVTLGLSVVARRAPIVMRLDEARFEGDALTLELAFINGGGRDIQGPTTTSGNDAILVADGAPHAPRDVTPSLATDLAPSGVWGIGETHSGALVFDRPQGETATLRLPGFPPVQINLQAGAARAIADDGATLPSPTPNTTGQAIADIRATLLRLAEAVQARDQTAYDRLVGVEAQAYFGDPQDSFAFARALSFSRFELELLLVDLNAPDIVLRQAGEPVAINGVLVALNYSFQGVETEWFRHVLTVDFERSPTEASRTRNQWRVARVQAEPPPFWAVGLIATTRSPHFLAFHTPGQTVGPVLEAAETAYANLVERLDGLVAPTNVIVIPPSLDLYTRVTQQSGHSFIGQARFNNLLTPNGILTVSRALYINEASFVAGGVVNTRIQTIQHELTHLAFSGWSRPWTPPWLIEGAAGVMAGEPNQQALNQYLRANGLDGIGLADLTGIDNLEQASVPLIIAYAYSTAVSEVIIEQYGMADYLRFYRAFTDISLARARRAAGTEANVSLERFRELQRAATDETLANVFGISLAELETLTEAKLIQRIGR